MPVTQIKPRLSFLVAAFRAESFLPLLVSDLLRQADEGFDIEIVISPDCDFNYRASLPQDERIIFSESGYQSGPSVARTRALNAATGSHIILMDADDCVSEGYLSAIFDSFKKYRAVAVRSAYHTPKGCIKSYEKPHLTLDSFLGFYGSIHVAMPREWLPIYPDVVAEDALATIAAMHYMGGSLSVANTYYNINVHDESFCAVMGSTFTHKYREAFSMAKDFAEQMSCPDIKGDIERLYSTRLAMSELYDSHFEQGGSLSYHDFATEQISFQEHLAASKSLGRSSVRRHHEDGPII